MRHGPLTPVLAVCLLVGLTIFGTGELLTASASPSVVASAVERHELHGHDDASLLATPACTPRPKVIVVTRVESGRLRVEISASTTSAVPANGIQTVRFGSPANARVRLDDGTAFSAPRDVNLLTPVASYAFSVERTTSGNAHVPLTIVDACGDWATFVGGGNAVLAVMPDPTPVPTPAPTPRPTLPPQASHDTRAWHPPTDHEHGDAPPQWIMDAGYTVGFDQHGGFHGNTSPAENTTKHAAMKGFSTTFKGVEVYFRVHIASNVLDRMARFHSYEVWARDPSGGVSHWQGWFNSGDPLVDRFPRRRGVETDKRPVVLVVDQTSLEQGIGCEQWYAATASWSWDFGWTVCGTTTVFYAGENSQTGTENWLLTGATGAEVRRLEAAWYDNSYGRYHPVGTFWATQFGEGVFGPNDPRCSTSTTRYAVSYQNLCLEQYIAPTMTEVAFPDNAVQKPFGAAGLRLPN